MHQLSSTDNSEQLLNTIKLPDPNSHKGDNGKLLVIGGSDLFHAASRWSLDVASKFVDMVFYSSVPSNNELIKEAKGSFWNGIVVERNDVPDYMKEASAVLIGPGMTRGDETREAVNELLSNYKSKRFVVDAGALQMVDPTLLHDQCIITPNKKELGMLCQAFSIENESEEESDVQKTLLSLHQNTHGATILLKGAVDYVLAGDSDFYSISGGNAGMTKGGTGDVLSGLIAALYCANDAKTSVLSGSILNKKAADHLYEQVGPFFNAGDMVTTIPQVLWQSRGITTTS